MAGEGGVQRKGEDWTEEEVVMALHLYLSRGKGRATPSSATIARLAAVLARTSGSVGRKIGNIQATDPTYLERGRRGLANTGGLEGPLLVRWRDRPEELQVEFDRLIIEWAGCPWDEVAVPRQPTAKVASPPTSGLSPADLMAASRAVGTDARRVLASGRDPARQRTFASAVMACYLDDVGEAAAVACPSCGHARTKANGQALLEAAHLVPWSRTNSYDHRWGVPLCPNCHALSETGAQNVRRAMVRSVLQAHPRALDNLLALRRDGHMGQDNEAVLRRLGITLDPR